MIRIFWRMNPGRNVVNLNWPAISADSVVSIQASEYAAGSQQLPDGSEQRFIGAADVTVENVTPHGPPFDPNRGVTFVVNVAWGPLNICTDVSLVANAPQQVLWLGPRDGLRDGGGGARERRRDHGRRSPQGDGYPSPSRAGDLPPRDDRGRRRREWRIVADRGAGFGVARAGVASAK